MADPAAHPDGLRPRESFVGISREATEAIAALFQTDATREPYEPELGAAVYAVRHRSEKGTLRLVLWPSLGRVDVTCGPHAWVAKSVRETEVISGLEVIFRFGEASAAIAGGDEDNGGRDGMMFVGIGGDVMMVSADGQRAMR